MRGWLLGLWFDEFSLRRGLLESPRGVGRIGVLACLLSFLYSTLTCFDSIRFGFTTTQHSILKRHLQVCNSHIDGVKGQRGRGDRLHRPTGRSLPPILWV